MRSTITLTLGGTFAPMASSYFMIPFNLFTCCSIILLKLIWQAKNLLVKKSWFINPFSKYRFLWTSHILHVVVSWCIVISWLLDKLWIMIFKTRFSHLVYVARPFIVVAIGFWLVPPTRLHNSLAFKRVSILNFHNM
jgi:hypothetical protein